MKRLFVSKYQERAKELYEFHLTHNISPTVWLSARQIEKYKGGCGLNARVKREGGLFSELKPIYFEYVDSKTRSTSCNTPEQWTCKFDDWLFNEYEFTNQELDELRSNKDGQGGCKTPEKVTNG